MEICKHSSQHLCVSKGERKMCICVREHVCVHEFVIVCQEEKVSVTSQCFIMCYRCGGHKRDQRVNVQAYVCLNVCERKALCVVCVCSTSHTSVCVILASVHLSYARRRPLTQCRKSRKEERGDGKDNTFLPVMTLNDIFTVKHTPMEIRSWLYFYQFKKEMCPLTF